MYVSIKGMFCSVLQLYLHHLLQFLYVSYRFFLLSLLVSPTCNRRLAHNIIEPVHEISNNLVHVCATNKASDQPAHTRSLIRAFASRLSIL